MVHYKKIPKRDDCYSVQEKNQNTQKIKIRTLFIQTRQNIVHMGGIGPYILPLTKRQTNRQISNGENFKTHLNVSESLPPLPLRSIPFSGFISICLFVALLKAVSVPKMCTRFILSQQKAFTSCVFFWGKGSVRLFHLNRTRNRVRDRVRNRG